MRRVIHYRLNGLPEQRRATLHRAIERGLDSDELWKELAEVSLELGYDDEAYFSRLFKKTVGVSPRDYQL